MTKPDKIALTFRLILVNRILYSTDILSDITGRTPDLQCRFENRWKARLLRPGGPIVKFIVDLGTYVNGSDWTI